MRERETLRISREEEDGRGERMENGSTFVYRRALRVRQRQDSSTVHPPFPLFLVKLLLCLSLSALAFVSLRIGLVRVCVNAM